MADSQASQGLFLDPSIYRMKVYQIFDSKTDICKPFNRKIEIHH